MIVLAVKPMVLYRDVLTLDVAGFFEAITECSGTARIRRPAIDESDDRRLRLLRACRERPRCRRAAEQRDERAAPHGIPLLPRTGRAEATTFGAAPVADHSKFSRLSRSWVMCARSTPCRAS